MKVTDIARVVAPDARHEIVGIRPGEKLHEQMIGPRMRRIPMNTPIISRSCPRSTTGRPARRGSRTGCGCPRLCLQFGHQPRLDGPEALADWIAANRAKIGAI
jgi:UDP-N-acetylglucosamine 4,6-dehydratase/5-epimerase